MNDKPPRKGHQITENNQNSPIINDETYDPAVQSFINNFGKNEKQSTQFLYTSTPMEMVEQNPEEYIIPECLDACKILWTKNIFTGMCSNNNDNGTTWIAIEQLSENNSKILEEMKKLGYVSHYRSWHQLIVESEGKIAKELLEKLASQFNIQDIPCGYTDVETFLANIGISKEIPNSQYIEKDISSMNDADRLEYLFGPQSSPTITVYDETKLQKPIQEYVEDNGLLKLYVPSEGRIYDSEYYLQKHNNFLHLSAKM